MENIGLFYGKYRALLIECRALLIECRALFDVYRPSCLAYRHFVGNTGLF